MNKTKDTSIELVILNAAKTIFEQKGMEGARMQEIADEANINKALLHYYFRSKQQLFETVFKNAYFLLAPRLNKILNNDDTLFEKIKAFTENYISFISKHPYLPNFIIAELNRNPTFLEKIIDKEKLPKFEKFKKQVEENVAKGIIKPIDANQLFINILSLNLLPFLATPLIKTFLRLDHKEYEKLLENRKTEVSKFIINAIKV